MHEIVLMSIPRYELHGKFNNVELRNNVGHNVLSSSHYACPSIAANSKKMYMSLEPKETIFNVR